jgi:hypothetical protein
MNDYKTRICAADDFSRAFKLSHPLLKLRVQCEAHDKRISDGIANDTVAALLQARDLLEAIHAAGLTVPDLQRWVVEWGKEWKQEEQLKLELESLTGQRELAQSEAI